MIARVLFLAIGVGTGVPGLEAQLFEGTSFGVVAGTSELVLLDEGQHRNALLHGTALGVEGRLAISRVELDARYLQAAIRRDRDLGSPVPVGDLVEGDALLGIRLFPWLRVEGGPRVRGLLTPSGTRRLVRWSGGASARAPIVRETVWLRGLYWQTLSGNSNARGTVEGGRTIEWGLIAEPRGWFWWGELSYRLDRDNFAQGTGWTAGESSERIVFTLGVRVP